MSLRLAAPLALMGLIFYLSAQAPDGTEIPEWARVVAHFAEYAVLSVLWLWALAPRIGSLSLAAAALISVLYAISDEYHQSFVDGRDSDLKDVLVDSAGVATALVLAQARGWSETRS